MSLLMYICIHVCMCVCISVRNIHILFIHTPFYLINIHHSIQHTISISDTYVELVLIIDCHGLGYASVPPLGQIKNHSNILSKHFPRRLRYFEMILFRVMLCYCSLRHDVM